MEYKKFTVVVIAALVASLIFAGTILAPIQSYAAGSRAQHMNQGTCVIDLTRAAVRSRPKHIRQ